MSNKFLINECLSLGNSQQLSDYVNEVNNPVSSLTQSYLSFLQKFVKQSGMYYKMLNKSRKSNPANNFAKNVLVIIVTLGFLGIGTKAYAWQEVDNAKIVSWGCFTKTCFLTINKDHPFTSDGTASCVKRKFAWDRTQKTEILGLVKQAYNENKPVKLRYSEYHCYDASKEGGDQYMDLGSIELK